MKQEARTSSAGQKKGRKSTGEQVKKLVDTCMKANLQEIRDHIWSWECDLRQNLRGRDLPLHE